jgi:hypothetical protein
LAIYKHLKTGNLYEGVAEAIDATNATEGRKVMVYQALDTSERFRTKLSDMIFVRDRAEFDQKFSPVRLKLVVPAADAPVLDTHRFVDYCPVRKAIASLTEDVAFNCIEPGRPDVTGWSARTPDSIRREVKSLIDGWYRRGVLSGKDTLVLQHECRLASSCAWQVAWQLADTFPEMFTL